MICIENDTLLFFDDQNFNLAKWIPTFHNKLIQKKQKKKKKSLKDSIMKSNHYWKAGDKIPTPTDDLFF